MKMSVVIVVVIVILMLDVYGCIFIDSFYV